MLENQELQLTHKLQYLAHESLTSQVTEQISDRCTLHKPVNLISEENNKMLFQVNLPVPVSHKSILLCNNRSRRKKFWNTYLVTLEACEKFSSLTSRREKEFFMYLTYLTLQKFQHIISKLAPITILYGDHLF